MASDLDLVLLEAKDPAMPQRPGARVVKIDPHLAKDGFSSVILMTDCGDSGHQPGLARQFRREEMG